MSRQAVKEAIARQMADIWAGRAERKVIEIPYMPFYGKAVNRASANPKRMHVRQPNLRRAEEMAYLTILMTGQHMPTDPMMALRKLPYVNVFTYKEAERMMGVYHGDFEYRMGDVDGFTVRHESIKNKVAYAVVYRPRQLESRNRFTLAHELGHVMLGHKGDYKADELEADHFASCFLAPVAAMMDLPTDRVLGKRCHITAKAAQRARWRRRWKINPVISSLMDMWFIWEQGYAEKKRIYNEGISRMGNRRPYGLGLRCFQGPASEGPEDPEKAPFAPGSLLTDEELEKTVLVDEEGRNITDPQARAEMIERIKARQAEQVERIKAGDYSPQPVYEVFMRDKRGRFVRQIRSKPVMYRGRPLLTAPRMAYRYAWQHGVGIEGVGFRGFRDEKGMQCIVPVASIDPRAPIWTQIWMPQLPKICFRILPGQARKLLLWSGAHPEVAGGRSGCPAREDCPNVKNCPLVFSRPCINAGEEAQGHSFSGLQALWADMERRRKLCPFLKIDKECSARIRWKTNYCRSFVLISGKKIKKAKKKRKKA